MHRICNISHNDLDGIVSAINIRNTFPQDHIKTVLTPIGRVHQEVKRALESSIPWDKIILTDLSIKVPTKSTIYANEVERSIVESLPDLIKSYVDNGGEFIVIDHHDTAMPMKFFFNSELHGDSILTPTDNEGNAISGSELAAIYMNKKIPELDPSLMSFELTPFIAMDEESGEEELQFMISEYTASEFAKTLTILSHNAGDLDVWRDPFSFGGKLSLAIQLMDDPYSALEELTYLATFCTCNEIEDLELAIEGSEILNYYYSMAANKLQGAINLANKNKIEHIAKLHQVEVKFFPDHCAHAIYTDSEGIVVVTYANDPHRVSIRGSSKIDIHLGEFAKQYGGGGHKNAAGLRVNNKEELNDIVKHLKSLIES